MEIKVIAAVGDGEVLTLTIPQEMWIENNDFAHWHFHEMVNKAIRMAQRDVIEERDYYRWYYSGQPDVDDCE